MAVADIGTDHAYIPVYLLRNRLAARVIASDSRNGPLRAAEETAKIFNIDKMVDIRLGDGLTVLEAADHVDVVVIAGMGGETICSILDRGQKILKGISLLVLQPMTEPGLVRSWLVENGYGLVQEDIAQEGENYYEIMAARQDNNYSVNDPRLLEVGPLLVENKHPLLKPLLKQRLSRTRTAAAKAEKSISSAARNRNFELRGQVSLLEEVLSWL
jgi:tRNA (adenine22-N1)-methyltransferase